MAQNRHARSMTVVPRMPPASFAPPHAHTRDNSPQVPISLRRATVEGKAGLAVPDVDEQAIEFEGEITEALPNTFFRVELDGGHMVLAKLAGRMRRNYIRVNPGDRVKVEVSPYDLTRGRITYRLK